MITRAIDAPLGLPGEHSPVGIGFDYRNPNYEGYWLDLPAVDRRYIAFLLEHVYGELRYSGEFKTPAGFIERATALGKL
jgi:hypothetical protein